MQTFLPLPSLELSVKVLDNKRLGKQRVEALQILQALNDPSYGWQHHPAVKMWRGYPEALKTYYNYTLQEFAARGFHNIKCQPLLITNQGGYMPDWFGLNKFHASHRSNLLRKNPNHYGQFGWTDPLDLPYYWPR